MLLLLLLLLFLACSRSWPCARRRQGAALHDKLRGRRCLPNLHAWTGCSCRHVTLPARGCRRAATFLEQLAAPWRKEGNWRLEDSKTHCVAGETWCFTSLREEVAPAAGQQAVGLPSCHDAVRGFGGARASRLPDRIGRRFDTASQLVCSTLLWSMGVSGRLP